jgi:hypothetical protein
MRQGTILEVGRELVIDRAYDELTQTVGVQRGVYGTTAVAHAQDEQVIMSPPYSRQSVFEAVADNIVILYPKLYTVRAENLVSVTTGVAAIGDDLAVDVLSVWSGDYANRPNIHAHIVDYHPAAGGRAVIANVPGGSIWVRYTRRMGKADSVDDTLDDLGVDERWATVLMVGAAADLYAGKDLAPSHTEWVQQVLQAENIEVGTRASLSVGMAQYRGLLIDQFAAEMDAEYTVEVELADPFMEDTRVGLG